MRSYALHLLTAIIVLSFSQPVSAQQKIKVKPGTKIDLRLLTAIDATRMKPGDVVKLRTVWPISIGQQQKIPALSEAFGQVLSVDVPASKKDQAELTLIVDKIVSKDFEIRLHAYPIRLRHKIARSGEIEVMHPCSQSGTTVGAAGPPAGSGEGNVVIRGQSPRLVSEPSFCGFGAPGVTRITEPMPSIKRVKQPPSTKLKERGNVLISAGTIIVVKEL